MEDPKLIAERIIENIELVIIGKQRHGPIGNVKLFFDSRYTRFGNLSNRGAR